MMINMFDSNLTGTIDVNEFGKLFQYINQWKAMFEGYDRDRSGQIDQGEFTQALQQMGYRLCTILFNTPLKCVTLFPGSLLSLYRISLLNSIPGKES